MTIQKYLAIIAGSYTVNRVNHEQASSVQSNKENNMKKILYPIIYLAVSLPLFANPITSPPKININSADINTLMHSIKGIGAKRAAAIIQYRQAHGAFKSLKDLASVHGFGQGFIKSHEKQLEDIFVI